MSAPLRPILPPDLRAFYAHARAATYAANQPAAPNPALLGAHELCYAEGGFLYEDRYFDNPTERPGSFFGMEIVRRGGASGPVVATCGYGGGLTEAGLQLTTDAAVGQVLQPVLREHADRVRFGERLRVHRTLETGRWVYADEGEIRPWGWTGIERIWLEGVLVYSLSYQGGCLLAGY